MMSNHESLLNELDQLLTDWQEEASTKWNDSNTRRIYGKCYRDLEAIRERYVKRLNE